MNMGGIGLVAFLRRFSNITSVSRAFLKRFLSKMERFTLASFGKYAAGSLYRIHAPNFKPHGVHSYLAYVCRLSPI